MCVWACIPEDQTPFTLLRSGGMVPFTHWCSTCIACAPIQLVYCAIVPFTHCIISHRTSLKDYSPTHVCVSVTPITRIYCLCFKEERLVILPPLFSIFCSIIRLLFTVLPVPYSLPPPPSIVLLLLLFGEDMG